ncbi:hypothetical protein RHGRI_023864 [Rhododendron griersonianum]|uniref:Uncharacterized protein n=1 Tax=Rhododendron griersonianum TaxID=479676 RepID=A0AAV6J709_9ERIC|nr:hypothetical protein RHGRI_023864 [Rhododendron griersonianum]
MASRETQNLQEAAGRGGSFTATTCSTWCRPWKLQGGIRCVKNVTIHAASILSINAGDHWLGIGAADNSMSLFQRPQERLGALSSTGSKMTGWQLYRTPQKTVAVGCGYCRSVKIGEIYFEGFDSGEIVGMETPCSSGDSNHPGENGGGRKRQASGDPDAMAVGLVTPEVQNSVVFSDPGGVSESFCFSIAVVDEIIVEIEASEVQGCEANILVEDSEASENEVTVISPKRKRHKPNKVEVFDKDTGLGWLSGRLLLFLRLVTYPLSFGISPISSLRLCSRPAISAVTANRFPRASRWAEAKTVYAANNLLTHRVKLDGLTPPDIIWRPYDGFDCLTSQPPLHHLLRLFFGEVKSLGSFLTVYDLPAEGDSATNFPWLVDEYFAWNKRGVHRYDVWRQTLKGKGFAVVVVMGCLGYGMLPSTSEFLLHSSPKTQGISSSSGKQGGQVEVRNKAIRIRTL